MAAKMELIVLQTRVPRPMGRWVEQQAKSEGLSVASWLRRRLMLAWVQATETKRRARNGH